MNSDINIFAETNFRNERKRFGIKKDDRRRHIYVIGKTGTGKTTLLENMVISDILCGNGVGIVDPHGEFAEKMLDFIPEERINDVIYFNPADLHHPIAFNPIETVGPERRHLVASGLMGVFKKIWPDVWSARMEYILNNTILALLESPGSTLLGIMRMLSNKDYRKKVLENVSDPVIKSFWLDEFARYHDRFEVEAIAPIQNKVGQFLSAAVIRNIVGQESSAFDIRQAMDDGKIIIMNLSKGKIGEDSSKLLGGLLVAKLNLAAMSRVDMPESERRDFYLYVDEFQNFATESFASILSEARKYHLNLVLANQYIAQLTEAFEGGKKTTVRDAVFGNVGTLINFRIGAEDADFLEKEFEPEFSVNDLVNLPKYSIYLKLMIDGIVSRAFSATTLPPYSLPPVSFKEEIIRHSRSLYSRERQDVEDEISKWADVAFPKTKKEITSLAERESRQVRPGKFSGKKAKTTDKKTETTSYETLQGQRLYEAFCWEGGEKVLVPFRPDGVRPIYCKNHIYKLNEPQSAVPESASISLGDLAKKDSPQDIPSETSPNKGNKKHRVKKGKPPVNIEKLRQLLTETKHQ